MPRGTGGLGRTPEKHLSLGTRSVHPPRPPEQDGDPIAPVLDTSSTYAFSDTDSFAKASHEKVGAGYVYTRWANPTVDQFEAAVAGLEGTADAEAFSTGMAAISTVFLALCSAGDKIAAVRQLYGNSYSLLTSRLPRYGITTEWADVGDPGSVERALDGAKLLYCETISNPRMEVADLPELARLAGEAGIPLIVDNTFASPILCRPVEHGATIVLHSATKFLGGHHDLMGGIVCADPDVLEPIKLLARDFGPTLAPFNAWLAIRGIATLHLRVEHVCRSAMAVAEALETHPGIEEVCYPGLASSPSKPSADELLGGRGGGVIGFEVAGGRAAAARFQERLRLIAPAASLGGSHSLIVHAASVTHTQLGPDELKAAGIGEGYCRLAIGYEDTEDVIADLVQALEDL